MFRGGADSLALHALDVSHRELSRQIRILAQVFEIAAVHRRAIDVESRSEHEVHALRAGVSSNLSSHLRSERGIPRSRQGNASDHRGGRAAVANSDRAVGHPQAWQPKLGIRA